MEGHVFTRSICSAVLLALASIAYIGVQKLGILSHTGLYASQVRKVAQEMDKRCKILSRVTGKDMFGNTFYRGIYLGGATINANGRDADYSIYPLWWQESWLTNHDFFRLIGKLIFPR